jgi:hypothetical protein
MMALRFGFISRCGNRVSRRETERAGDHGAASASVAAGRSADLPSVRACPIETTAATVMVAKSRVAKMGFMAVRSRSRF